MLRVAASAACLIALCVPAPRAALLAQAAVPYWVSIVPGQARMRTGPGRNFPAIWLYQRSGLPLRVVETFPAWRKVVDPDGATGWMQANLLADRRTAMIIGAVRALRKTPSAGARTVWRAEPGVVGLLGRCAEGWCLFDVGGRRGYVEAAALWGVDPGEAVD